MEICEEKDSLNIIDVIKEISKHLREENRFSLPELLEGGVSQFCKYHVDNSIIINKGEKFYRARINAFEQGDAYKKKNMSAPPKGKSSSGRINPAGIPYLYVAHDDITAASEVRPWKGAKITIANMKTTKDLRVAELGKIITFSESEASTLTRQDLLEITLAGIITHEYFSAPAHADDDYAYLASQYIAEKLKGRGIDGIKYPSVLHEGGWNVCIFNPKNAEIIDPAPYITTVVSVAVGIEPQQSQKL